ncbi:MULTISPECIES: hypothetical protein [unclassified Aureispira]|uniref:hypothetical protein n=1 Tax=unclassified Aureispira TaxID=2649989 RepID=UPI000698E594|nr:MULTISPECIES: hypothetical protein [unclassified Aureispira]WMX17414.1 hypothetical protein QP953_13615 [Aureispira sp. CCB-E]
MIQIQKSAYVIFLAFFLMFLHQEKSQAQAYQRIPLSKGASVCVIADNIVNKPKDKSRYQKPWDNIQFNGKKGLVSIRVIETSAIKEFDKTTPTASLIRYILEDYFPIDSNCIFSDTLKMGKIKQTYPFVDLIQTSKFQNYEGYWGFSSNKIRCILSEDCLYILYVHCNQLGDTKETAIQTRKDTKRDFGRLICSFQMPKQ